MANPMTVVSIVQAIINLALKIKEEVETFRHNREDCRRIGELVATVRDVAEGLRKTTEKEDGDALLGGTLKALKQALERAWDVVVACQRKNAVLLALDAGAIAVKLRRVYLDVSLNLSAVVLANGAYNTSKLADINGIVAALRGDVACNTMMLTNILKIVAALPDALLHLQQQVARLVQSFSDASYYQNESIRETKKTDGYSTYSPSYAYPVAIQRLQSFSDSTNDNASYYQNKTTREIKKTNDVARYSYSSSYNYPLAYPARQTSIQKSFSDSINVDPPCSSMGREGVVAGPAAEGSKSRPECINSSNPYHECSDYCLRKIAESRQRLDGKLPDSWKRPPEQRTVHPDCINASNPYHECSDYCFRRIADAKSGACG